MILCFLKFILGAGIYNGNSAGDLAGIQFPKLKRSAYIMNLKFLEKTTFCRLRGKF